MTPPLPSHDQVCAVLRESEQFAALSEAHLQALVQRLQLREFQVGSYVYREGEPADSVVIVVSGSLRVSRSNPSGALQLYNELHRGDSLGETGLLLQQPRPSDLIALRDAVVGVLDAAGYEALLQAYPVVFNRLFAHMLYRQLRHTRQSRPRRHAEVYAIIPLDSLERARLLCEQLAQAFGGASTVRTLLPDASLQRGAALERAAQFIEQWESVADALILCAEPGMSEWTRFVLREADQAVFVAGAGSRAQPGAFELALREEAGFAFKRQHLVILHAANTVWPDDPAPWRSGRPSLERFYPVREAHAGDHARLARFLAGRAVGVVLGGGGARGFAHIGVLQALYESAVPVDLIGGNSMGALIGSQVVLGHSLPDVLERVVAFARGGERPTLPVVSLLSGRRMERDLQRLCDGVHIERLWQPFFAAACNLSRANTSVLEQGPLWRAVLASNSPAGLLPPVPHHGDLLVDGAILDNVPVQAMRQRLGTPLERRSGNGVLIAVDVDVRDPLSAPPRLQRLSAWNKLRGQFGNGQPTPGIVDILYHAGHIGGLTQRGRLASQSDFYLQPPVSKFSLMAYKRAREVAECGYEYARAEIGKWDLRTSFN